MSCGRSCHNINHPEDGMWVSSCETKSQHILDAIWFGWIGSQYIDYITGLPDLPHILTRHEEYMVTHPWPVVLRVTTYTTLRIT